MVQNKQCLRGCLDSGDCLESIRCFKRWNTFFLLMVFICLLILQAGFHIVDRGYVKTTGEADSNNPAVVEESKQANPLPGFLGKWMQTGSISRITFGQLEFIIDLLNVIILLAAILYCFSLLFSLNISLQGKLGGAKHISRSLMLSLFMFVLLWPWQRTFGSIVTGAVYTPEELAKWYSVKAEGSMNVTMYYLRFGGYGILTFLLLFLSALGRRLWARDVFSRLTKSETILYSVHKSEPSTKLAGPVEAI